MKAARLSIEERSRSNYRITDDDKIGQGSPREKIKGNIAAIRLLKDIEGEGREATAEEKAKLVKYVGWGAFSEKMFNERRGEFAAEQKELRLLLTPEEYEAARASTLNAHYTSPDVVSGMWDALSTHLGFDGGYAIEPSAGAGHFIGLIPDGVAPRTAWTAVEIDPITGRLAKALYGGADVNVQGFETLKRPSNYYDLAISNVPFGDYKLTEKPYGSYSIHDFFFVKSLDKVRPGGVVSFVTSRYTLDRVDASVRRKIADSADLVGAIRLPGGSKGAFAGNAGTQVTTDILFLRKRFPGEAKFGDANWMDLKEVQTPDGPTKINEYFADRPEMMLGEMRLTRGMYTENEPTLVGEAEGLRDKIFAAAQRMPAGAFAERAGPAPAPIEAGDPALAGIKEGGYFEKDGEIFRRVAGVGEAVTIKGARLPIMRKLIGLRDIATNLLGVQTKGGVGADALREQLRSAYDAFVAAHGPINREERTVSKRLNKRGEPSEIVRLPNLVDFLRDPDAFRVASLENYNRETGTAERAAIQLRDVIAPIAERKINSADDALAVVLDTHGRVDMQKIGELIGAKDEDEVAARLGDTIYHNPDGRQWEPADLYLSGDVVTKLEEAEAIAKRDPRFQRNVDALKAVQPAPLTGVDISAQLGAPWIPVDDVGAFLHELGFRNSKLTRLPLNNEWRVDRSTLTTKDADVRWGIGRSDVTALDIVRGALNNKPPKVYDRVSEDKVEVNQAKTEEAAVKVAEIRDMFSGDPEKGIDAWAFRDAERAERLEAIYNRQFNNIVRRQFNGDHLTLPGMSADLTLNPHQKAAVWRILQTGDTLLDHVVGAGKTYSMVAAGMEQKRLGLVTKPAYAVPNHMLEQFSREFLQAYPNAKILVADKEEISADARRAFVAKTAANDWDAVIMTHSGFGRIAMSADEQAHYLDEQVAEFRRTLDAAKSEDKKSPTVKQMEKAIKRMKERKEKLLNVEAKDEGLTFEETGIDQVIVDEAHLFKNLAFSTRRTQIKGLSMSASQRAEDLFMKIRYLERSRPNRGAIFATGTPISNTMAEMWTMLRYLGLDRLKALDLDHFDSWADTFGKIVTQPELSSDARTLKDVSSFSRFVNIPELINLWSQVADSKTADMLNLPRPKVVNEEGKPGINVVTAKASPLEQAYMDHLVQVLDSLKGKRPEPGEPNVLSVVTAGRKVATDGRLVKQGDLGFHPGQDFEFNPKGKIALAAKNIAKIYKQGNASPTGKAQMVFLDLGVPKAERAAAKVAPAKAAEAGEEFVGDADLNQVAPGEFDPAMAETPRMNLYEDLRTRLAEAGVPPQEVAFIHEADTDEKKAALFEKVREGKIRVIVGSTSKMGVGTNVQKRLIAMHHLDAPWKPAEVEQRDGRILRQGNLNPEVGIYRYITEGSFDSVMWQTLERKAKFIGQVTSGSKGSRIAEDIDNPLPEAEMLKAAASGDPRIMQHAELTRQVRQLTAQKRAFELTRSRAKTELNASRSTMAEIERVTPIVKEDGAKVVDLSGEKFKATIGNQEFTDRKEAGAKILDALLKLPAERFYTMKDWKLGNLSGFDMALGLQTKYINGEQAIIGVPKLKGAQEYSGREAYTFDAKTDPLGLIRRFEFILREIGAEPARLESRAKAVGDTIAKMTTSSQSVWPREKEYAEAQNDLATLTAALKPKKPEEAAPKDIGEGEEEAPAEGTEYAQGKQGAIKMRPGERSIISLFRDANASTFMHESAHDWLEQLMRDAAHAAAPEDVKADATIARKWLGAKENAALTRAQHERFARGFEQYLREGVAPSKGLAGVFARFKNWLTTIYQTLKGLGKPISEDIKGVFDRLLELQPQRTVISPEAERGVALAAIHEADAAETPPHSAEPVANRIKAERETHKADAPQEIANGIASTEEKLEAVKQQEQQAAEQGEGGSAGPLPAGEAPTGAGGGGPLEGGGGGPGPAGPGVGVRAEPGAERPGGGGPAAEGVAGRPAGPEQRPVPGEAAGAQQPTPGPADAIDHTDERLVDRAGNIRLDNLDATDDVKQAIRDAAERNANFIGDRRGRIMDSQVEELADALGMDYASLSARKIGEAFNAEQVWAARKLLIQSAQDVAAKAKAAADNDEALADYALARERHKMIQGQVAGLTAEAGRALRAFRAMKMGVGEQALDEFLRGATGRTLYQLKIEAKLASSLDSPEGVSKFIDSTRKRGYGSMVLEYWINGLISGPATHVTYTIGNTILSALRVGETELAAIIGAARARAGREGARVLPGEAMAQVRGARLGIAPAAASAAESFRTGLTARLPGEKGFTMPFQPEAAGAPPAFNENANFHDAASIAVGTLRGLYDGFRAGGALLAAGGVKGEPTFGARPSALGAIPDITFKGVNVAPVGTLARAPSRMIAAIHSLFRGVNYSMEKSALAYRAAVEEGHTGDALAARMAELYQNPTEEVMKAATQEATQATLMGKGSEFTQALARLTNVNVFGIKLLKFIDPFVRISSNVIDQSIIQRTPAGILAPAIRADLMGANGNIAQDRAMARMIAGSALTMLFGGLAASGYATGSGPSDPKQAAMWRLAGYQAHSIRVGDTWYDVHRLGPMGMLMGMAADLYDVAHTASQGDFEHAAALLQHAATQNILDESFMRGPADLIRAVEDPGRYGDGYVRQWVSSFMPYSVGMAQMARAMDPYSRQARDVISAIKRSMPGESESLAPRRDVWGQPIRNPDALIGRGLTSIYEQALSHDPVNVAMLELGISPAAVERKIRNVTLSDQQYDDYARIAGGMAKMRLDKIVAYPGFATWPASIRADVINTAISQSRETARGVVLMKFPQLISDAYNLKLQAIRGPRKPIQ